MKAVLMVLVAALVLVLGVAACGGDDEEAPTTSTAATTATVAATASPAASPSPPAATPTAAPQTATATGTPSPPTASPEPQVEGCADFDPAFCAFAAQVEDAILNEDVDFFVANSLTVSLPCTQEQAAVGAACDESQIGETITGVPYGREALEGTLLEPEEYRDFWAQLFASDLPEEQDDEGSGELRIRGVGYANRPAVGMPRNLVLTYVVDSDLGPVRQALGIHVPLSEGQWQIYSLYQYSLALGPPQQKFSVWREWPR